VNAINVMVGTPAYGGMVHLDYVRSLFGFLRAGIQFESVAIGNESLITRARNTILAGFHRRKEFSHLLFLDADVLLSGDGLARMLAANVPVIGAPVALKGLRPDGSRVWNIGNSKGSQGPLLKVDNVGTAALLLARAAADALVDDAIAAGRAYSRPSTSQGDPETNVHYDVFQVGVHEGVYLSEDYWACRRLQALGFDIFVDPTIVTVHNGVMSL
jgi:hypothetical protein